MKPIRILHVFGIMARGGAETMIMNYYRQIDRSLVQFDFMVHRQRRGSYDDEIESMGGHIFRMPPIYPHLLLKYKTMLREFFKSHTEYCIIHSHLSELGYFALQEAEKSGIAVRIVHAHSAPTIFDLKAPIRFLLKKMIRKYTTHFFVCSNDAGLWLFGQKHQKDFVYMYNAINVDQFKYNIEDNQTAKRKLDIKSNFVIGHVGLFVKAKNHFFILDVFSAIVKREPSAMLVFVGDGPTRPQLEKHIAKLGIAKSVLLLGVRSDVAQVLKAMDVFMFPSLYEGLGMALIEAQASGLPCLASDKVPIDAKVTELLEFMSLEMPIEQWANKILQMVKDASRSDHSDQVKAAGYDVSAKACWLQDFYLARHEEAIGNQL